MLDRVEVHVVDVALEILFTSNRMLPKAPLPQRIFAVAMALDRRPGSNEPMREMRLDSLPAAREIRITGRQCPDGMRMVGQDHNGIDRERTLVPRDAECHS